ncbi:hypothetical protein ACLKA7_005405 [Drosophila subpalustris]
MFTNISHKANYTWHMLNQIIGGLWNRLYLPKSAFLALPLPTKNEYKQRQSEHQKEEEMPRTRRRHHSRDRSSAGTRDKRRRLDTGDLSPPLAEAPSPTRITKTHHTRSAAKRRRHEIDANTSHISKEPTHGRSHGRSICCSRVSTTHDRG